MSDSCDPMDYILPGSSVHGILQARILEWVAISFSRGSSRPSDQTRSLALQADSLQTELWGQPLINYEVWSESYSVVSNSLQPHGLYSPWNSPGQNTGVSSLSLLQGTFPTQVSCIAGRFSTSWARREAQVYWSGYPISSPADLPNPGIKPGSPALQDSLPVLSGRHFIQGKCYINSCWHVANSNFAFWNFLEIFFPWIFSIHGWLNP